MLIFVFFFVFLFASEFSLNNAQGEWENILFVRSIEASTAEL